MKRALLFQAGLWCVLLLCAAVCCAAGSAESSPVVLLLDGSASMWEHMDGREKIELVRQAALQTAEDLPEGTQVGLVAFGHRRKGDCGDVETLRRPGVNGSGLVSALDEIWPKGKTPLASALEVAAGLLPVSGGKILLIGDGWDTCGGDPSAAVRHLRAAGRNLQVDVLALSPSAADAAKLKRLAEENGGIFQAPDSEGALSDAVQNAVAALGSPLTAGGGPSASGTVTIQTGAGSGVDAGSEAPAEVSSGSVSTPSTIAGPCSEPADSIVPGQGDRYGEDCACSARIRPGQQVKGAFQVASDKDVFRLESTGRERVSIRTSGADSQVKAYDGWCAPLGGADASGVLPEEAVFVELGAVGGSGGTGDYSFTVGPSDGNTDGAETAAADVEPSPAAHLIEDDHGNGCPCSTPLPLGAEVPGALEYAADRDAFVIEIPEAGRLAVYTLGGTETRGTLYDDWCRETASDSAGGEKGNFRMERDVVPGKLYVSVAHPGGANGKYRIKAEMLGDSGGGFNLSGTWKWTETATDNTLGLEDKIETGTAVFKHTGNSVDIAYDTGSRVQGKLDGMTLHYVDKHVDEGTVVTEDVRVQFSSPQKGAGEGEWVLKSPLLNGKGHHEIVFEKISD